MMISHSGDDDDYVNYDSDDSVVDDDGDDDDDDSVVVDDDDDGYGSFNKRIVDCFNMILYDLANLTFTYYIQTC
jgi:hypothetical protein